MKVVQRDVDDAYTVLKRAWTLHDEADPDSDAYLDALATGVGVVAHLDLGFDDDIDQEVIPEVVAQHRERLSRPAEALFEQVTEGATDAEPEELTGGIDPESDDLKGEDAKAIVMARLLNTAIDDVGPELNRAWSATPVPP